VCGLTALFAVTGRLTKARADRMSTAVRTRSHMRVRVCARANLGLKVESNAELVSA